MMNGQQYRESLRQIKPRVYFMGQQIESVVDNPATAPHVNAAARIYDMANDPVFEELCTAKSSLTGKKINRFTHLPQKPYDLIQKQKMIRLLCQRVGGCIQRCMGMDVIIALSIAHKMDSDVGILFGIERDCESPLVAADIYRRVRDF